MLTNVSVVRVATMIETLDCSRCGSARASLCSFAMSSVPSCCTRDRLCIVNHGRGEVGMSQEVGAVLVTKTLFPVLPDGMCAIRCFLMCRTTLGRLDQRFPTAVVCADM